MIVSSVHDLYSYSSINCYVGIDRSGDKGSMFNFDIRELNSGENLSVGFKLKTTRTTRPGV